MEKPNYIILRNSLKIVGDFVMNTSSAPFSLTILKIRKFTSQIITINNLILVSEEFFQQVGDTSLIIIMFHVALNVINLTNEKLNSTI